MPSGEGDDAAVAAATPDGAAASDDAPRPPPAPDGATGDDGLAPIDTGGSDLDTGSPPQGDDGGDDASPGDDGPIAPPPDAPAEAAPPPDAGADVVPPADAPADAPPDVPPPPPPPCTCGAQSVCVSNACTPARRVFVTHAVFNGNLGGAAGADAKCAAAATAAGLSGKWLAWVSDSTTSPGARFTKATVGYRLLNGTLLAASYSALTSGSNLSSAIDLDETGVSHASDSTANADTWTGTGHTGALDLASCSDFKSSSSSAVGEVGDCNNAGGGHWSQATKTEACGNQHHLYCFEQ
jgi:hypothetical protein